MSDFLTPDADSVTRRNASCLRVAYDRENAVNRRSAPHNLDAERGVIGALLVRNDWLDRITAILQPGDFFDPLHQEIFETGAKLVRDGKRADPITLKPYFENAKPIKPELLATQYLGDLVGAAAIDPSLEHYAQTIKELAQRRALIAMLEGFAESAITRAQICLSDGDQRGSILS